MKIGVACGGTGGHLFPGLAVANILRDRGHEVTLFIDRRALDSARGNGWTGKVELIDAVGFSGGVSLKSVIAALKFCSAILSCWRRMRRNCPDVFLAMGSYASVGPVIGARLHRVPVILHEANAVPGRAISFLANFADLVALTFADSARFFKCRTVVTGLPVRRIHPVFPDNTVLRKDIFTVLIMGGSQGAHVINKIAVEAILFLRKRGISIQVIHLTGKDDYEFVREKYHAADVACEVYPFLEDMGRAYGIADVAVCRAGASTCMELAAFSMPSLLVPLPGAMRNHQEENAKILQKAGAADMIRQNELTPEYLAGYLEKIISDPDKNELAEKKDALEKFAVPDAAKDIADLLVTRG